MESSSPVAISSLVVVGYGGRWIQSVAAPNQEASEGARPWEGPKLGCEVSATVGSFPPDGAGRQRARRRLRAGGSRLGRNQSFLFGLRELWVGKKKKEANQYGGNTVLWDLVGG